MKGIYIIEYARTGERINEGHSFGAGMTAAKKGVSSAYANVAIYPFDGIIVQRVIVAENVIAQGVKLPQHVIDRFGKRTSGQGIRVVLYLD